MGNGVLHEPPFEVFREIDALSFLTLVRLYTEVQINLNNKCSVCYKPFCLHSGRGHVIGPFSNEIILSALMHFGLLIVGGEDGWCFQSTDETRFSGPYLGFFFGRDNNFNTCFN